MFLYQELCGGKEMWANVIIILTKIDYNPMVETIEQWEAKLK